MNFSSASEHLRGLFLESIGLHMRSDVPLAAALSGGLDSSAVVCAMRYLQPNMPLNTFTFVAPGQAIDETAWAQYVNQHVGAISHRVEVHPDELAADLDEMITAQGEPFGSTSIYAQFRVFKAARQAGMLVTLDGQGADELLAGYAGYPHARLRTIAGRGDFVGAARFLTQWQQWPGRTYRQVPQVIAQAFLPEVAISSLRTWRGHQRSTCLDHTWFLRRGISCSLHVELPHHSADDLPERHLAAALRHAQTVSGLPSLLRHADRNSMHWSLETGFRFSLPTWLSFFSMPGIICSSSRKPSTSFVPQCMELSPT